MPLSSLLVGWAGRACGRDGGRRSLVREREKWRAGWRLIWERGLEAGREYRWGWGTEPKRGEDTEKEEGETC